MELTNSFVVWGVGMVMLSCSHDMFSKIIGAILGIWGILGMIINL